MAATGSRFATPIIMYGVADALEFRHGSDAGVR